jgi:hypothetical protein
MTGRQATIALAKRGWPAAVVLAGSLSLWLATGADYWRYVLVVLIALGCAGLGYYVCWATVVQPTRQQAAERPDLDRANQHLVSLYEEIRERCMAAEAELENQRAETERLQRSLAQARQASRSLAQARQAEAEGTGVPHTGSSLTRAGHDWSGPTGGSAGSDGERASSELAPDSGELVVRVRCYTVADEDPSADGAVRLGVERTVIAGPRGQFTEVLRRVKPPGQRGEESFPDRFVDAVTDYCAEKVADPVFEVATRCWETSGSYPLVTAANRFTVANGWLNGLVERPLDEFADGVGIPAPVASPVAGIGADIILEPVAKPLTRATEVCAAAGVLVGAIIGAPHLVGAGLKILAKDGLHRGVAEVGKGAFREIGIGRKASIEDESDVTPASEVAGEALTPARPAAPYARPVVTGSDSGPDPTRPGRADVVPPPTPTPPAPEPPTIEPPTPEPPDSIDREIGGISAI